LHVFNISFLRKLNTFSEGSGALRNEELHNLYLNEVLLRLLIKEDEMGGTCNTWDLGEDEGIILKGIVGLKL
jgi:hypothetical protein